MVSSYEASITNLPTVCERVLDGVLRSGLQVGIIKYYHRVLAAQLNYKLRQAECKGPASPRPLRVGASK